MNAWLGTKKNIEDTEDGRVRDIIDISDFCKKYVLGGIKFRRNSMVFFNPTVLVPKCKMVK